MNQLATVTDLAAKAAEKARSEDFDFDYPSWLTDEGVAKHLDEIARRPVGLSFWQRIALSEGARRLRQNKAVTS